MKKQSLKVDEAPAVRAIVKVDQQSAKNFVLFPHRERIAPHRGNEGPGKSSESLRPEQADAERCAEMTTESFRVSFGGSKMTTKNKAGSSDTKTSRCSDHRAPLKGSHPSPSEVQVATPLIHATFNHWRRS